MAYYSKLPIVLLSEIASSKEDSYNCRIAAYLLGHLGESLNADQIARDCFVSKSAVSRFCREVGLEDFIELKQLMADSRKTFELISEDAAVIAERTSDAIKKTAQTLNDTELNRLVSDILGAKRIVCLGLLKAQCAALDLQSDLTMLGINCCTKIAFKEQVDYLSHSKKEDLIIIFSYHGIYFNYDLPPSVRDGQGKIWVITGDSSHHSLTALRIPIRGVLSFASDLDFVSHPYQLMFAARMIAQRTALRLGQV